MKDAGCLGFAVSIKVLIAQSTANSAIAVPPLLQQVPYACRVIMNSLPALGAKEVVMCEMVVLSLALSVGFKSLESASLPLEVLFPAHVLYYLLTCTDRTPDAHILRKCVGGWLYVFGDMLCVSLLLHEPLPASWRFLVLEYVVIFVAVYLFPAPLLKAELASPWLRGLVYQLEALYKSSVLLYSLKFAVLSHKGFTRTSVPLALLAGISRLCVPVFLYTLERLVFTSNINSDLLLRYLRSSPLIAAALLWLLYQCWPAALPVTQEVNYTPANLIANIGFMAWYSNEAVRSLERSKDD